MVIMLIKQLSSFLLVLLLHTNVYAKSTATIIYAADLPIIGTPAHGDYAELATLVANSRGSALQQPHFFLFGGASLAPSPLSSFDSGSHIVDILNQLEPDVMAVTKREFSYFEDELTLRSYEAAFPLLLSNAVEKQTNQHLEGTYSHLVISKQDYSIGLLSIIDPSVGEEYLLRRLIIKNPKKTVVRLSKKMRSEGADLIVLLHSDYFPFINEMLEASALDLAIQSESKDKSIGVQSIERHPNSVVIETLGTAAIIDIENIREKPSFNVDLVELDSLSPNPEVASSINRYKSRLQRQLQRPIGRTTSSFSTERSKVRSKENGFANLITDAMMHESRTQMALINSGVIRGDRTYAAEQMFMFGDLLDELPFRTRMVVLEASGSIIKQALENSVSQLLGQKGRFPQVSGISFTVVTHQAVGQRITNLQINGQPIQADKLYTVATTDYLAEGGDGFSMLKNASRRYDKSPTMPLISDVLARYLSNIKGVNPYVDGRITMLGSETE